MIFGSLVLRFRFRRATSSTPDSTKDPPCVWTWCTPNQTPWVKHPPVDMVQKFGDGVPIQTSFSLSDSCSELRGSFQNSPPVDSKWSVNITKLN
ncbi:hypothetical protein AVEN_224739-1 [Araneus ventricosus]|uniref:Uncharacterized protein n=1 Tax=Araneus ventricosus TaxID=182803 RepID=A0A4Y2HWX9_ARAVE|nr:hypothetical protein AVEN_224739-1 [Araneus ventricosus]